MTARSLSEEELIGLLRRRDQRGFAVLYDNYSAALYGIILRIVRSEELAADVMQEAFVKVWKNFDDYNPSKGKLFTWLLNVARNLAIDKTRSLAFRQSAQNRSLDENVELANRHYANQTDLATDMIGMDAVIQKLRPDYQRLIELIYLQGYTQAEAAHTLGIPLGTVKTRVRAAILELRTLV